MLEGDGEEMVVFGGDTGERGRDTDDRGRDAATVGFVSH